MASNAPGSRHVRASGSVTDTVRMTSAAHFASAFAAERSAMSPDGASP